jgi:hypothetical protein
MLTKERVKQEAYPGIDTSRVDVHRDKPRAKGGRYVPGNMRAMTPVEHMKEHGIHREREPWHDELKALMDSRSQTLKLALKINNQLLAVQRGTDTPNEVDMAFITGMQEQASKREGEIKRQIEKHLKKATDPTVLSAMGVVGMGAMTVAGLTAYIDIEKARSASALWAYVGIDSAAHARYTKNEAGGGNKTLRTILWNCANSMTKNRNCPYREVYDRTKARLQASEKMTRTRVTGKTGTVEMPWSQVSDGHRHGAALRAVMKHVLADYWFAARAYAGLDTRPLYVEGQLGHTGIIRPGDRGWALPE